MIKKIDRQVLRYKDCFIRSNILGGKINELVDAVNALQSRLDSYAGPETPTDPYAEQRKWIGKLCMFWDDDVSVWKVGTLVDIRPNAEDGKRFTYKPADSTECFYFTQRFKYCRPVAADEELIYKGK